MAKKMTIKMCFWSLQLQSQPQKILPKNTKTKSSINLDSKNFYKQDIPKKSISFLPLWTKKKEFYKHYFFNGIDIKSHLKIILQTLNQLYFSAVKRLMNQKPIMKSF